MFKARKIRRAAAHLTATFPEIPVEEATNRARRMVSQYPRTSATMIGDYLVHGERVGRVRDGLMRTWLPEGLR
ncbi:hypothetical protein [Streptomyces sp. SID2119]|uniref:hypothetical protein n=1 Tax=Streptomyces sp. SID2119 TaxID=2690253 RepID=UPI00136B6C04|nr:hypothetical protein [Streptomyces sp. SID2119]MYW29686.1 hypothetical protein [Streptomyces sp. SID2119]